MRRADKILTISEFSRQEIVKYYGVASDKLMVMPMGVDANRFYPAAPSRIENAKKTYRISGEYYMYLGTLEPRKNIETLIKAYDLLKRQHKEAPKLVIAGGKGWLFESIFETVQALGLADSVLFTGYVGAEDVAPLLSGALAFVFPSIYEGFGMPVLEAMACGAPVIASNVSSIPEVAGDCAMLVTPDCAGPWAQAMWEVWQNETLRQQLRESGQKRAAQFTWERAANILLSAIKELAD